MSTTTAVGAAAQSKAAMNTFERYLTVWVALCIVAGVALGSIVPAPFHVLGGMTVARSTSPWPY
jgi:ACR3 family arsenite transporter